MCNILVLSSQQHITCVPNGKGGMIFFRFISEIQSALHTQLNWMEQNCKYPSLCFLILTIITQYYFSMLLLHNILLVNICCSILNQFQKRVLFHLEVGTHFFKRKLKPTYRRHVSEQCHVKCYCDSCKKQILIHKLS